MMHQLGFQLFDGPDGDMLADFGHAERVEISDGDHGFEALTAFIPMTEEEAFRWYAAPGVPWAVLSAGWGTAWEGRVEDVAVVDGGLEVGAFGAWRALSDAPYTALWSRTTTAGWRPVTSDEIAAHEPARYEIDNNNRLYLALRKNEAYGNLTSNGGLTYAAPHNGTRGILKFYADYDITLPTNWVMRLLYCTEAFGSLTALHTVTGTGSNLTGTIDETFTESSRLVMEIRNTTGSTYTMTADTGTFYAKLTNIRISTSTAGALTPGVIAAALIEYINKINPAQLLDMTHLINEPYYLDLGDEIYEDEWPADILAALSRRGDDNWGDQYEVGVWEGRVLHYRPRYSASRTWLVEARDLTVRRTMDTFRNQMYAVYRDANNRLKRTSIQTTIPVYSPGMGSRTLPDFNRRGYVNTKTTNVEQAETERNTRLAETSVITPRAGFRVDALYDETGSGPYPLWMARAGDLVIVQNLAAGLGTAVDRLRNFRIKRKRYSVTDDILELTPELELPDLAVMAANSFTGADVRPVAFTARESN